MAKEKVFVALSGGVDSSVAALLLKEAGYEVIGITMHLWCEEKQGQAKKERSCCSIESIHDAEQVCHLLGIPFYVLNFEKEFQQYVVDYFYQEYQKGRTPNPCIACNQYIKFHFLLHRVRALGADYLATGHYARIIFSKNRYYLLKAVDTKKDQSYMLYTLRQEELRYLLFPIGNYFKTEVRQLARDRALPVADKPDSQDLCFTPDDYRNFFNCLQPSPSGNIVDTKGRILGQHRGLFGYTIGQRYATRIYPGKRLYVIKIDVNRNQIIVGEEGELYSYKLIARKVNWVSAIVPQEPITITAKIRYKSPEALATLIPHYGFVEVVFDQPQRAITPGQAVVFYQKDEVLGGGIIDASELLSQPERLAPLIEEKTHVSAS